MVPIMGTMSFVRPKSRKLASGEVTKYYYEVENYWKNGRSNQRVLNYLGNSPYHLELNIDSDIASQIGMILFQRKCAPDEMKQQLQDIGIPVPEGEIKEIKLVFNPPLGNLMVHIS